MEPALGDIGVTAESLVSALPLLDSRPMETGTARSMDSGKGRLLGSSIEPLEVGKIPAM